ncbi:glycosyltransferase [Demequina muriae]|uniref:Glycosyltransferase n=1 Tax=Demequina muriae TaxID=3051664 RepID=A0ABT8GJZ7_9MICO|nr:glycosyltransferase [Demequina sp. EGI L300058]MDN4481751.1 glycosyltransferase [Demequina sp. EGI L300058]
MTAPEVSVILPAYNAAATLPAQLGALAAQQGAPSFELIVSDNGSDDLTAAVAREHRSLFPSLTVIDSSARRGPSAARNAGAAHARAPMLAFCDADDVASPGWLASLVRAMQTADAVAGAFEHRRLNPPRARAVSWNTDVPIRLASWPDLPAGASSNLAITAEAFRALGGFDEDLGTCEDIDLCWRAQLAGYRLDFALDAVVHERKRSGLRATYRQSVAYARGTRDLERKHRAVLGSPRALDDSGRNVDEYGDEGGGARGGRPTEVPQRAVDPPAAPPRTGGVGRIGALGSRLRRPDRLSLLADLAWRLGQRRAHRTSAPQREAED